MARARQGNPSICHCAAVLRCARPPTVARPSPTWTPPPSHSRPTHMQAQLNNREYVQPLRLLLCPLPSLSGSLLHKGGRPRADPHRGRVPVDKHLLLSKARLSSERPFPRTHTATPCNTQSRAAPRASAHARPSSVVGTPY